MDGMSVRAKFKVTSKSVQPDGSGAVGLQAVYGDSPENKAFFKYTPAASIMMNILNPAAMEQFEQQAEYYVDFTRAE